jgi:hypothetical protein
VDRKQAARGTSVRLATLVGASLAVGVLLRGVEAHRKSLWLDEMHSLYAARGSGFAEVIERVRVDFHPPLYFLLLHFLDGIDPHAQRWLSILFGIATLLPLLALLRSAGLSPLARAVACGLYCTSSYQILYAAELRAYSGLELCAATMAWAAFTDRAAPRWRFLAFAAATAVGLYLHYFAAVAALAILAARPLLGRHGDRELEAGRKTHGALAWRTLAAAGAMGFALFLPWLLTKERWLVTDPGKMWRVEHLDSAAGPGPRAPSPPLRSDDLVKAATIPLRTYAPMLSSLGRPVATSAQVGAAVFFALVLAGGAGLLAGLRRGRSLPGGARLAAPIGAGAIAYLVGTVMCLAVWRRVPAQYFVVGAWIWPLGCAALVDAIERVRLREVYAGLLLAASLAIGVSHVLGASRENMRGAVETAVKTGREEGAILTAILWQPPWYPHALPYLVYAPGVEACEPQDVPPAGAAERRPVVVITRNVAFAGENSLPIEWRTIREGRRFARSLWIDNSIEVAVFEPE